jgi:hypothetical protein
MVNGVLEAETFHAFCGGLQHFDDVQQLAKRSAKVNVANISAGLAPTLMTSFFFTL